jgi:hypothetical protein
LTHSRWVPECPPLSNGSTSGNIHFVPSDSVYTAVATCKPPNAGPIHCDLLICGPGTILCYICSVTYRDGAWLGDHKITIYWCGVLTFTCGKSSVYEHHLAQTIHRHIPTRTAPSHTGWLQQNFCCYWTWPQTVPSVKHKYMAAILKVLKAQGRQIISPWGLHCWTHALTAPYYWSWRQH